MKKVMLFLLVGIFLMSFAIAQGQGDNQGDGTGTQNPDAISQQTQDQNRIQVQDGTYVGEGGQQMMIQKESNNQIQLRVKGVSANCGLNLTQTQSQNKTKLETKLSNGRNAEIKIMPDTASETALARLRLKVCSEENECQIELKEVGQGEQVKAAYEMNIQRQAKFLGMFGTRMQVQAQVDAETGEVIQTSKPWWAFLASELAEE